MFFTRSNIDDDRSRSSFMLKKFGNNVIDHILQKFNPYHDVRGRFTSAADSVRNAMREGKAKESTRKWIKKHKLAGHVSMVTLDNGFKVMEKAVSKKDYEKKGYSGQTSAIAYELSKELGFSNFPVTALLDDGWTIRTSFIEGQTMADQSMTQMKTLYEEGNINHNDAEAIAMMAYLKHDPDMHGGNILVDGQGRLWAIDMDGWSNNSSSEWKEKRRGLSKVMSGKEITPKRISALKEFVKNADKTYKEKFQEAVPEKEWKAIVRRAGKMAKKGIIP